MRRYKRAILRARAEKLGVKPSSYVREAWDRLQSKAVGAQRGVNVMHGTRRKSKW